MVMVISLSLSIPLRDVTWGMDDLMNEFPRGQKQKYMGKDIRGPILIIPFI